MKSLEVETLNAIDPRPQSPPQKKLFSAQADPEKSAKRRGKSTQSKFDGSDFGSLESSSKPKLGKSLGPSFENTRRGEQPREIFGDQMRHAMGDKKAEISRGKSIETESVEEEKIELKKSEKSEEIMFEKKRRSGRYFDDLTKMKCFKCGQTGHTRNTCLDITKVTSPLTEGVLLLPGQPRAKRLSRANLL